MKIETTMFIKRLLKQKRFTVDVLAGEVMTHAGKSSCDLVADKDGYLAFSMLVDGKRRKIFVHEIVAVVGDLPAGKPIYHLNGNKLDNRLCNLTTEEPKQTIEVPQVQLDIRRLEKPQPKLTEAKVREIKIKLSQGYTHWALAIEYGVSTSTIANIKYGRTWAHVKVPAKDIIKLDQKQWHVHWQN